MDEVRVLLRCGGLRLEYRGARRHGEAVIASLLGPLARSPRTRGPQVEGPLAARSGSAPAAATAVGEKLEVVVRPAYEPPRDRFGTFQRQLEVAEGDPAQLVAAYAFFLWNYEKRECFTEDEVAGCFAAHGVELPEEPGEVYGDLLSQRMLSPGAAQNTWRLTTKGRDYVRHHLLSA